jgi:transcriptional regulator with XRE-family HTH domain
MAERTYLGWMCARTLNALKNYYELSDEELGQMAGMSRSAVQARRTGTSALSADDMDAFCRVFAIPPEVLLMSVGDALRWVLDNDPRGPGTVRIRHESSSACTSSDATILAFPEWIERDGEQEAA